MIIISCIVTVTHRSRRCPHHRWLRPLQALWKLLFGASNALNLATEKEGGIEESSQMANCFLSAH